jgi:23S rRNA (uridine2552-2'-O)-methyltransferase
MTSIVSLKKGGRVVDLALRPAVEPGRGEACWCGGGHRKDRRNRLLPTAPLPGVHPSSWTFDPHAPEAIKSLLGGPADVVLSDMAANATGHRQTDHLRIMALAEAAADFGREVLSPGGAFLCKVLQGGTETTLLAALKRDFASVKHVKPSASRADSAELYLLATGFRGQSS